MANAQQKQGWEALKNSKTTFISWTVTQGLSVERVEFVATFEEWDTNTEIYVFFPLDLDLEKHKASGAIQEIETIYRQLLIDSHYPFEKWPVRFYFDSHENVVKNYESSYFKRLR